MSGSVNAFITIYVDVYMCQSKVSRLYGHLICKKVQASFFRLRFYSLLARSIKVIVPENVQQHIRFFKTFIINNYLLVLLWHHSGLKTCCCIFVLFSMIHVALLGIQCYFWGTNRTNCLSITEALLSPQHYAFITFI